MSNDIKTEPFVFRKELVDSLGNEAGKTIYKHFTKDKKYTEHNLSYLELKQLIDVTYAAIYEEVYVARYGTKLGTELLKQDKKNGNKK